MKVRLIIDSTVDLPAGRKERFAVVPLTVLFGQEEYIDGVSITQQEFYEKLVASDVLPTTSQATPEAFGRVFAEVKEAGQSAVVLTLSSKFSGTCQSAMIAAAEYENIYIVDTGSVAIGAGILAEMALQLADAGKSAKEIAEILEQEKQHIRIIAMVDTLEYLKKGGRVSKTVAFAGGLLNIKPVLSIVDGEIHMVGKARGAKQGNNLLDTEIAKAGGVDIEKPVLLGYTGLTDEYIKKYIADSKAVRNAEERSYTLIGSVIGTHAGPGVIAAAFFSKNH